MLGGAQLPIPGNHHSRLFNFVLLVGRLLISIGGDW